MPETSFFYDDTTLGDSTAAPYSVAEITAVIKSLLSGEGNNTGFVIPANGNDLEVLSTTPVVGKIKVESGAALVGGYLYENTADVEIAVPSVAANPRWDRIVLRIDTVAQTIRLTRVAGTENAAPNLPALQTTDYELARLYVSTGYNAAIHVFADSDIHDTRAFYPLGTYFNDSPPVNLLPNSEWLAFSGIGGANPPDGWLEVGATTSIAVGTPGVGTCANNPRVRQLVVTGNAGTGITTTILIPNSGNATTRKVSMRGTWSIAAAGQVVRLTITPRLMGGATGTAITKELYRAQAFNFWVYFDLSSTYDAIDISFTSQAANTVFTLGQLVVTEGYQPGGFVPVHELIMFNNPVGDASWTADAYSSGTVNVNLATAFNGAAGPYIRGAIIKVQANDSGSAAAITFVGVELCGVGGAIGPTPFSLQGVTNDTKRSGIVYVQITQGDANATFSVTVTATGPGTCDVTLELIGIIT